MGTDAYFPVFLPNPRPSKQKTNHNPLSIFVAAPSPSTCSSRPNCSSPTKVNTEHHPTITPTFLYIASKQVSVLQFLFYIIASLERWVVSELGFFCTHQPSKPAHHPVPPAPSTIARDGKDPFHAIRAKIAALGRVMVQFRKRRGQSLDRSPGRGGMHDVNGSAEEKVLDRLSERGPKSRLSKAGGGNHNGPPSDMELVKERFAKLLLGEDRSGGGKGVSSALALSNAITNLAASVFGEQRRLEPMPAERKERWRKEVDWLLSATDHIVELVPSQQTAKDGTNMEIMITRQRKDLHMNIPALRKLDAMLIGYLDTFKDHNEFFYASKDDKDAEKGRTDDKWWLPTVKVPPQGLSDVSRKWLQFQKESVNQVLKASMAINAQVLMEMEIPEAYTETLPKNGRASLGDSLYRSITVDHFDPEHFFSSLDLSTEHKILDLKNRIEASIVIWKRKMHSKDSKSSWNSTVSLDKREQFEDRAETILLLIKQRFPGIPQSALDISKIQYNRDVGQSVLESYSRILETLAFTVMSRIEDVLYAHSLTQDPSSENTNRRRTLSNSELVPVKKLDLKEEMEKLNSMEPPTTMTLSDFMGWNINTDTETEKKDPGNLGDVWKTEESMLKKPPNIMTNKKFSYIENLGGTRSPTARH